MATIEINLPEKLLEYVDSLVETGDFTDRGDVIKDILRKAKAGEATGATTVHPPPPVQAESLSSADEAKRMQQQLEHQKQMQLNQAQMQQLQQVQR